MSANQPPLTDGIAFATAALIDDAQGGVRRDPSHADLDFLIQQCDLASGDPKQQGLNVGKEKRVRSVLTWAIGQDAPGGRKFVARLIEFVRSRGGFRTDSPHFVGEHAIRNLQGEFLKEGIDLSADGEIRPRVLEHLSARELTQALQAYVRRAQNGVQDAALLTGTSKDLLEAVCAHVLSEVRGITAPSHNFPTLLGQAFVALNLTTPQHPVAPGETPQSRMQRALFDAALAVNTLRNKQGTGHGHPWISKVSEPDARRAIQVMGLVADMLLDAMAQKKP